MSLRNAVSQRAGTCRSRHGFTQQRLHVFDQRMHVRPYVQRSFQHLARQWVALLTPVVLRGLGLALAFIGLQRFIKQVAAVKSMFAQHALAPGVDGVDGGIVHTLRSHVEPPCGGVARLAFGVGIAQVTQEAIVRSRFGLATETLHSLNQAGTNTV